MKKLTVDGITFEKAKDAKAAERELDAIEKIRGRMDVTDPVYAKVLYEKLIEKEMLHTKVGEKFLAELQGYFDPEAVEHAADAAAVQDAGTVQDTDMASVGEAAAEKKTDTVIPYLDEAGQAGLDEAIAGDADVSDKVGVETENEEEQPEEYFGATGLDALVEEYDEYDAEKDGTAGKDLSREAQQPVNTQTKEAEEAPDEADLDAFMREYGLKDAADSETMEDGRSAEEDDKLADADLDALMDEYGVTETESTITEQENSTEMSGVEAATEPPLDLNTDGKEKIGGEEEGEFHLNLDVADLYEEEPDDATLLEQARTLKKELHQEDLSEVFTEHDNQTEKKRFSLYGVLLVSILLNIILIASMAIMVQVFKNSDNRNILNYERILEQEYQTATPTDAEAPDADAY